MKLRLLSGRRPVAGRPPSGVVLPRHVPAVLAVALVLLSVVLLLSACTDSKQAASADTTNFPNTTTQASSTAVTNAPTTAPTTPSVSSPADAVTAAVRWALVGITRASSFIPASRASAGETAGEDLFVYTYSERGRLGRMESVKELREPAVPFPLVWSGDTYFLSTENFEIGRAAKPGVSIGPADIEAGLGSAEERWRQTADYAALAFSMLRMGDPLRLLGSFVAEDGQLPDPGADGKIILTGHVNREAVIGCDLLLTTALKQCDEVSRAKYFPERLELELTLATNDWRPIELRIPNAPGDKQREVVMRWERAGGAVTSPGAYTPLIAYIRPATDPGALLGETAAWLREAPVKISYPSGSAIADPSRTLFEILELPGSGSWGGAFAKESEAGSMVKKGGYFLWQAADTGVDWVAADEQQLYDADVAEYEKPADRRDPTKTEIVYRAILRSFLLEVLDPTWIIEQIRVSLDERDKANAPAVAVSQTSAGYRITSSFNDERVFATPPGYTSLIGRLGNPPPSIAERESGRSWNYTMEFTVVLETDAHGVPLSLTLSSNAPDSFAPLKAVDMKVERTDQPVRAPQDGRFLPQVLNEQ